MFTAGDDRASRSVAVLGATIPDNLGCRRRVSSGRTSASVGFLFQVIGVLASKGSGGGFRESRTIRF